MRALALLSSMAVLLGCPSPPRRPPLAPAPPVLDVVERAQLRRLFPLKGNVVPEQAVRLYVDAACAGPVYLQTTGVALREGVQIELVAGVENVFSADAVSSEGGVSGCSNAIVVTWVRPLVPGIPSLTLTPRSPSKATSFLLKGAVNSFARAQLHETDCSTPVLEELDSERFYLNGFTIEVPRDGSRTLAVNSINLDEYSPCAAISAINDSTPPAFQARLASPTPSSNPAAFISFTGERVTHQVFDGLACSGPELLPCSSCDGPAYYFWDGTAGRDHFELFFSADCTGEANWVSGGPLIDGLQTSGLRGFVTVRGIRLDGGVDPCSNAVALIP